MTRRVQMAEVLWTMAIAGGAGLLGLIAVISPLVAIAGAVAIVFVMLVLADLTTGVALFTFVSFVVAVIPGIGELSVAKAAGLVLVLSWLAAAATSPASREQLAQAHPGVIAVGALFLGWVTASALWAEDTAATLESVIRYVPNLLLIPIVYAAVRTRRDLRLILIVFVAGVLVSTLYGGFIAPGDVEAAAEGRVSGAATDPNYLAATLVAALALCGGAIITRAYQPGLRAVALLSSLFLLTALMLTASRTGVVALIAALATGIVLAGRGRRLPSFLIAAALLTGGAFYVANGATDEVHQRLTQVSGGTGRTDIWTVGVRMIAAEPLTGVGAGNFPISSIHYLLEPGAILRDDFIVDRPKVAHNIYLEIWAELGLVGLVLFLSIVGFVLVCALRAARAFARHSDAPMELLARSSIVATVAMLTAAAFNSMEYEKTLWLMLAIGPCLLAVARREGRL